MLLRADARHIPLADSSVQMVCTSPPYWGLRDYGTAGQIGLEQTPDAYVAEIVAVFREARRVLRDDGTLWLNLGDSYANDGKWGGETGGKQAYLGDNDRKRVGRGKRVTGLKPKDLVGIPWRVAFALQADGWWLRSDVIWHKTNPMPESVSDRPVKCHEYVFLLTKSDRYVYYADAVKERASGNTHSRGAGVNPKAGKNELSADRRKAGVNQRWKVKQNASFSAAVRGVVEMRHMRTVWAIPTQPYPGAHYATFPEALAERCILAGTKAGDLVLDPFGGSGTTARVATSLGRRAVHLDLSAAYMSQARERTQVTRGLPLDVA